MQSLMLPGRHPSIQQQRCMVAHNSPTLRPASHHLQLQPKKKQLDDYTQPEDAQTLCLSSSHLLPEDNASWFCLAFIKRKVIKRGSGAPSSSKLVDSANHWLEKESSLQKH